MPKQPKKYYRVTRKQIAALKERLRKFNVLPKKTKRLEEELSKSELLRRVIDESVQEAIFIIDLQGRISYWNSGAAHIFGYTREEILGKNLHELLAPESLHKLFEESFPVFKNTGRIRDVGKILQMTALGKNRGEFPIELSLSCLQHMNGEHAVGIVRDMTEHALKEKELRESREWLSDLTRELPAMICEFFPDSTLTFVNKAYSEFFGMSSQELIGQRFLDLIPKEQRESSKEKYIYLNTQQPVTTGIYKALVEGEIRELEWRNRAFFDEQGQMVKLLGIGNDVTDRERAKNNLENQLRFEKLLADISNVFVRLPSEQIHKAIDYTLQKVGDFFQVGRCYVFLFSGNGQKMSLIHEWCAEGVDPQKDNMQDLPIESFPWWAKQIRNREHVHIPDIENLPPEAEAEWKEFKSQDILSVLSIPLTKEENVLGLIGMDAVKEKKTWTENDLILLRTVSELISNAYTRYQAEQEIQYLTFHDPLTGLYNRHYLKNEIKRLNTERQLPIGIIMADLNNFKLVNDISGHEAGDEVLKYTAEILRNSCRSEDIIVRWGGDEFVILLPQTPEEGTKAICNRIKENFQVIYIQGTPVSLALGHAIKDSAEQNLSEVHKTADEKMYAQKLTDKDK